MVGWRLVAVATGHVVMKGRLVTAVDESLAQNGMICENYGSCFSFTFHVSYAYIQSFALLA